MKFPHKFIASIIEEDEIDFSGTPYNEETNITTEGVDGTEDRHRWYTCIQVVITIGDKHYMCWRNFENSEGTYEIDAYEYLDKDKHGMIDLTEVHQVEETIVVKCWQPV